MTAPDTRHEESWLLLPWLANGRLAAAERARLEEHVRACEACAREVAWQRLMGQTLAEPDRVTYAPGPSFRKLMERIDGGRHARVAPPPTPAQQGSAARARSLWRPPGLAWAASFVLLTGIAGLAATAYRWSQPLYATHTTSAAVNPDVLHIAFDRSLSIGEVEQLLRAAGARIVEGPGTTGIFGVTAVAPATPATGDGRAATSPQVQALAARLRADARVRWVEPLATAAPGTRTPEH
jgi:anti-sigma factor RsiW